jgi:hypothetical protein
MREIDKNMNSLNFKGVQKPFAEEPVVSQPQPAPSTEVSENQINDLKNMPAPGQSQINKDNIDNDMNILLKNPDQVAQLNMIFDKFQENHTYEESAQLMDAYKQEFLSGKH